MRPTGENFAFQTCKVNFPGDGKLYVTESCNFKVIEDGAWQVPGRCDPNWSESGAIIEVKSGIFELYIKVAETSGYIKQTYVFYCWSKEASMKAN